jgi:hypothetical protein
MAKNDFGMSNYEDASAYEASINDIGVIKVGKREYAVGLLWHKIEDVSKAANEARLTAANENQKADFFCLRLTGDAQFGLGFKVRGHKNGLPSLAAQLASAKGGKWLGLFQVENGYYLAAVYEDAIMSECDRFFSNADEAKEEFENFYNSTDWKETIAPDSFEIPGTNEVSIAKLLEDRISCRLQSVSKTGGIVKVAVGLGILVGAIGGVNLYLKHLEDIELARLIAMEAEKARSQIFAPKQDELKIPDAPWVRQTVASHYIDSCVNNILKFPLDIPGWNVKELICDGNIVAAAIDRSGVLGKGGGSFNWIKIMVENEGFKPTIIPPPGGNGNRASVQWDMGDLPKIPVDVNTLKTSEMRNGLISVMDERFIPVQISDGPSNSDFFRGIAFAFSTNEDPRNFTDIISALTGSFITRLSYQVDNNLWTLEGQAYEQLPLPTNPAN